jgi:hypothetical protein
MIHVGSTEYVEGWIPEYHYLEIYVRVAVMINTHCI